MILIKWAIILEFGRLFLLPLNTLLMCHVNAIIKMSLLIKVHQNLTLLEDILTKFIEINNYETIILFFESHSPFCNAILLFRKIGQTLDIAKWSIPTQYKSITKLTNGLEPKTKSNIVTALPF